MSGAHRNPAVTLVATALAGALAPASAISQDTVSPPRTGVIDRPAQERRYVPPLFPERKSDDARPYGVRRPDTRGFQPPENADEVLADITRVNFEGNSIVATETLQSIAAPYLDKPMTRGDLARLKFEIGSAYYDRGFVLVRVVTPPQSLADGILDVRIVEARVGQVVVENDAIDDGFADHLASRFPVGEVFEETAVETAVSDITDLRNVRSSLTLRPGSEVGTTDLVVKIEELDEDVNTVSVDNYGSEFTGEEVANLRLEKSNSLGRGETFGIDLRQSLGGGDEDLTTVSADMIMPTSFQNWRLEAGALYSENEIGDRLAALDSTGESTQLGIGASRTFVNTRRLQTGVRVGMEARNHESFLADVPESEDRIRQFFVEGSVTARYLDRLIVYGGVRLIKGLDALGADEIGEADATRVNGDPEAFIVRPSAYIGFFPTPNDSITLTVLSQHSSDVLLSSDLFAVGGHGSVRGFEPGKEAAESGFQTSLQYNRRIDLPTGYGLVASVFYDYADVDEEVPGTVIDDQIDSYGMSLAFASPSRRTRVTLDWAHVNGDYIDPDVDDDTVYLRIAQDF